MAIPAGGDPGTAEPKGTFGSLPSPLDSVADMRSAAKWMLAASGAVGAVLISGGPLLAIGQVHGGLNIFLAVLGLVLAVGGVGLAIWFTSEVLVPRLMTPATFRSTPELKDLRDIINAEPGEFFGGVVASRPSDAASDSSAERDAAKDDAGPAPDSATGTGPAPAKMLPKQLKQLWRNVSEPARQVTAKRPWPAEKQHAPANTSSPVSQLFERQEALRQNAASLVRQAAAEKDPNRHEQYRAHLRRVEENGERVGAYVRYVLALGHAWRIKAALQAARRATLIGAVLVIAGAALFFSATASSGPTYVPVVTTNPTPAASPTAKATP
jgi:hypothetical protein